MINYKRTNWYGLHYLLRIKGSLLPQCMPSMMIASLIAGLTAAGYLDHVFGGEDVRAFFGDPYSMQMYGIVRRRNRFPKLPAPARAHAARTLCPCASAVVRPAGRRGPDARPPMRVRVPAGLRLPLHRPPDCLVPALLGGGDARDAASPKRASAQC